MLFFGLENIVPVQAARYLSNRGLQALASYLFRVALLVGTATGAVALLVGAIPQFWLSVAYGEEFVPYDYLVRWYAVVYLLMSLNVPLSAGLRVFEETRPIFWAGVSATCLTLFVAYPLIHQMALTGAIIGLLAIELIRQTILAYALTGEFRVQIPQYVQNVIEK